MTLRKTLAELIAGDKYRVVRADIPAEIRVRNSAGVRKAMTTAALQRSPITGGDYQYLTGEKSCQK